MAAEALAGVIRWEDPPPPRDPKAPEPRPWSLIAHQLRSNPGQWALIDDAGNTAVAPRISMGQVAWWRPRGAFEAVVRYVDGRPMVYARYIGEVDHGS